MADAESGRRPRSVVSGCVQGVLANRRQALPVPRLNSPGGNGHPFRCEGWGFGVPRR